MAGTYDGASQKLYINGQLAGQTASSGAIDWDPLGDDGFEIGRYHDDNEDFTFDGLIDDVRVYNRAITGAEAAILAAEPPSANRGPVAVGRRRLRRLQRRLDGLRPGQRPRRRR